MAISDNVKLQYGFFHGNSKFLTKEEYTYAYNSTYKHGHIVLTTEIFADELPYLMLASDLDTWITNNPGIIKKYTNFPLTTVLGSNNEMYYIKDSGKWIKPMILPELVVNPTTNIKANAYQPLLYRGDGTQILGTDGDWFFDPYQGAIKFATGSRPTDLSWGTISITCYVYIGKTLDNYLEELKPITYKYQSEEPNTTHVITHNLNSMDLDLSIMVQDPVLQTWEQEYTGILFLDSNTIQIDLTIAANIRACISIIK